ncbi:MAG TPA: DUF4097 family beta strand repeat-containing protein [Opitutaceae bacterium]|nr:DUF4097 family beta strand repeat-containing protein [Opitutaceae bacterium]
MNLRFCSAALLALAAAGLLQAETYREPFSEIRPLSPSGTVELQNTNGSITIRTWNRNEVQIAGEKEASDRDDLQDLQVEIEATPDAIVIRGKKVHRNWMSILGWSHSEAIRFNLMVPAGAHLASVHTVNGPIDIAGTTGPVRVDSVNGPVQASGLRGGARISTVNGAVHAAFASVGARDQLSFSTVNGAITVMLPRSAAVQARTSTINGHVTCDFPYTSGRHSDREAPAASPAAVAVSARTVNGAISLRAVPDKT